MSLVATSADTNINIECSNPSITSSYYGACYAATPIYLAMQITKTQISHCNVINMIVIVPHSMDMIYYKLIYLAIVQVNCILSARIFD